MFCQQFVFGGFEYLISLFNLNRLGINASGNAIIFVFVGIIVVLVQGKYIGPWSRKYGERKLIYAGLLLLCVGLVLTAITPAQTLPGYSKETMLKELSQNTKDTSTTEVSVSIPEDGNSGWLGIGWILVAMIPTSIGGGLLSPSINSLLTKNSTGEIGGTLGVSAALVSAANAVNPLIGGGVFKLLGSTAPFLIGGVIMGILFFVAKTVLAKVQDQAKVQFPLGS
jgi:MFS family permease